MKRTLCLFLALILAVGICFSAPVTITASAADIIVTIDTGASVTLKDADGDGYYDIGTADELYAFATAVNGGKRTINVELTADITINENVLTADGELNGDGSNFRVWTPIGYYTYENTMRYSGTFHGNDKTISGLYFNNSNVSYVGLFGYVDSGGEVKNVGLIDSYISGVLIVGGVVGANRGTVTNCYNEGMVSGTGESVGGVVGHGYVGTVTNCYNEGMVSGTGENVGGVVGYSYGTVTNCYNEGMVSGTGKNVGGVVGYFEGTMTNCYNKGAVSGNNRVGGVVGYFEGTMTNCYNKGAVSGNNRVGGVVGSSDGTVTNCYNEGTVSGTGEYVGGVVGFNFGTVKNCYNKGNISGNSYVGGVVGRNSSTVTNCYNEGTVSGTGERVGGVVGYNYMTCKNCYYLSGCATDGNNVTQFGIGNITLGSTTADVSGQTDSKTADWFTSGEVCATVGYHQGADAANGFCELCTYDPATLNKDEYYEISNAGQLFWFADYINNEDRTANAVLMADIDLENRLWTPIGKTDEKSNNFRGVFDGQGHTIRGLNVEGSKNGVGFFGEVRTGTVKNFTIYGEVNVKGECDYVGGVFGSTCGLSSSNNELKRNGAIIQNITSYVNLTAGKHGIGRIGGFVGYANHETLIENCSWYGTFDAGSYRVDTGAGGFIGNVHEGSNVTIRNCAAYGTIKTNYKKNNYDSEDNIYMGGFLSYSESNAKTTLENCLFAGKFEKGENLTDQAFLGAFGTLKSVNSIVNCYYLGEDGLEAVHSDSTLKPGSDNVKITSVTKAQLLSGEVANKLQGEENTHFWGQTIGTDDYPVLGGDKVYYGYISCADDANMVYTNNENAVTEKPKHTGGTASCKEKAVCENCGDSYGDFAPHTYKNGKCTAEGCGYACAHGTKGENGICTVCNIAEGTCGEKVTWVYDSETTTLTISGSGAMANYTGYDMPWYNYQDYIKNVVIENGVTTIGNNAFADCTSLAAVTIPDSITTIGAGAFYFCIKLISITIPESVTTISNSAFYSCTALTSIEVDVNNSTYLSDDNRVLFNKDKTELICYPAGKDATSYTIPDGVKSIGDIAFFDCRSLTTIEIPDSVITIGSYAFNGCTALASVTIPDSVETIGSQAFSYCTSLTTVSAPCSWNEKPLYTFEDRVRVVIPKHTIENNNCTVCKGSKCGATESDTVTWVYDEGTLYINGTGAMVADYDGSNMPWYSYQDKITKIIIENGVTTIGMSAFSGCDNLTSVTIGNGVTEIDDYAFDGCNKLSTVNVPCDWDTENPPYAFDESVLEKYHNIVTDEAKAPTCEAIGWDAYEYCTACNYTTYVEKAKLGHDIVIDKAVEATCTKTGLTEGSHCTRCDDETVAQEVVPALNHKDTLVQVGAKAKTCTEAGHNAHEYCTACDYTTKVEIPASHELQEVKAKAPTCEAIGWDAYEYCTACNYTTYVEKAKLGHDIVIDKAVEATCTKTGLTEGSHCTRCDDKTVKQNVIPTTGHKEVTVTGKAATCTATGLTDGKKCSVCGVTTVEQKVIAATGHKEVTVTGKAATCTATGLTDGKKCSVCGAVTKAQETIKATGHTTSVINAKAATCTVDGYSGDTYCSVCKNITAKGTVIKAAGHKAVLVGAKPATFEADGYTGDEKCSVCNQQKKGEVIKKLTLTTPEVTVKNTAKGITVSWNAIENAESYIVYRRVYNASTKKWSSWSKFKTDVTATSVEDATVTLGTKYRYTVRAVNGNYMSGYVSTSTIQYNVTPTVKVANNASGVKVTWSTSANATGYRVYRSTLSNGKWSGWKNMGTAKATKTSWVDKSVKTGVTYKYTVRAVYNKVLSSYNKTGAAVLFLTTPAVKIANASNGIKVSWNKISGATGYVVYSSQLDPATQKWSGWSNRGTINTNSWVDTAVKSGVQYKYTVRATNGKTLSAYKGTSGLTFLTQPTVKIANAAKGIKVTWSMCDGATGYTVYRSEYDAKTKKWSKWKSRGTAAATKSSWTDKKVTSGKYYKYTVRAVNGNVKSSYVSSGKLYYLLTPTVTATAVQNGIKVSWTQSAGAKGYTVYSSQYDPATNKWSNWSNRGTAKADKSSWVDKKAQAGVKYRYTVRAVNNKAKSAYIASNEVTK